MLDSHKLLTGNLELDPELKTFLNEGKWSTCTNYVTVSIIGAQGSGKSTLMNSIFGTEFATKKKGQIVTKNSGATTRTTVGADLSIIREAKNKYILLIDSEGIGCSQRLKDCKNNKNRQSVFETQLTSFILSNVDVLIINIMVNQIGHADASWQSLVRDIMEINAKYIQTDDARKKTIIYVIRDFDEEENTKEELKNVVKGFFEESQEESKEYDRENGSKSIGKSKSFKEFQEKYNIEFQFICYYKSKEDFHKSSKKIKSKIWKYFDEDLKIPEIGSLKSSYKANLKTILNNYCYSADELKIHYLKMEKIQKNTWEYVKKKIDEYLDLKELYLSKTLIIKDWIEQYKNKIEAGLHNHDVFLENMENLEKKTNKLLKKKGRTLYDNEINQLSNFHSNKVQSEILSSDLLHKPTDFKNKKLKQIKEFISYMKSDKFDLK